MLKIRQEQLEGMAAGLLREYAAAVARRIAAARPDLAATAQPDAVGPLVRQARSLALRTQSLTDRYVILALDAGPLIDAPEVQAALRDAADGPTRRLQAAEQLVAARRI